MSVSIYYQLERPHPLSDAEQQAIDTVLQRYDVSDKLEHYLNTGQGYNWETFTIYDKDANDDGVIFAGATKLPSTSAEASLEGLEHWLAALSDIRHALSGGTWQVQLDDMAIPWDDVSASYVLEPL